MRPGDDDEAYDADLEETLPAFDAPFEDPTDLKEKSSEPSDTAPSVPEVPPVPGQVSRVRDMGEAAAKLDEQIALQSAPAANYRMLAFITAAEALSSNNDACARHPLHAGMSLPEAASDMGALLWDELEFRESEVGGARDLHTANRAPERYFQRRREDHRRRRWGRVRPKLGQPWRRLIECSSAEARDLCIDIGGRMAAGAARGLDARELRLWLAPLEGPSAHRVAGYIVQSEGRATDPLADDSRRLFDECRAKRRGEGILSLMGRRLLAALMTELPAEDREAAERVARTNILKVLIQLEPLLLDTAHKHQRAWDMVRRALGSEPEANH
ncbi:MAG: hypothetical protein ACI841_000722 [Planctomycetota bacterium]|jgi:hypothetical protein